MNSSPQIRVGMTTVRVMKREANERGEERTTKVHEGVVVQDFGDFVRVFNFAPQDKGGDVSAETSELFPVKGPKMWCEVIDQKTSAFPIPASLR